MQPSLYISAKCQFLVLIIPSLPHSQHPPAPLAHLVPVAVLAWFVTETVLRQPRMYNLAVERNGGTYCPETGAF